MGLGEHLEELRKRLIHALFGLLPIVLTSLIFADQLIELITRPLRESLAATGQSESLIETQVLESFGSYFKLSIIVAGAVGAPWIIYQAWRFVAPGLYAHERRFAYVLAPLSVVLTIAGLMMMYFVMLPVGLKWLVGFGQNLAPQTYATAPLPPGVSMPEPTLVLTDDPPAEVVKPGHMWINTRHHALRVAFPTPEGGVEVRGTALIKPSLITPQYRVKDYLDLFFGLSLAFAISFQLPVAVLLLGWAGIISPAWLGKYRRHALVVCAVVGAILTPTPDPLSMILLVIPLYLLYELGVILLRVLPASRVAGKRPDDDDPPPSGAADDPYANRPPPTDASEG